MTDQLLPCPFCGKQPRHVPADYVDNAGRPWPFAECDSCHVGAPVEFWNTRAQLSEQLLVPRELLESLAFGLRITHDRALVELRSLLAQPADCEPKPVDNAESVLLTAVAVLRDDGDGGLSPDWLLEGGTAELFEGMTLLVVENAPDLCADDGHAELFTHPAPAGVALPDPESADVCPYWTDGQQRHAWIQGFKSAAGRLNGVQP